MVRSYLAAVSAGDTSKAITLRCTPAQPSGSDLTLWTDQAHREIVTTGPIMLSSVRLLPVGEGPVPFGGLHAAAHFAYRLTSKGMRSAQELQGVVVRERGSLRWCGYGTDNNKEHVAFAAKAVIDLGTATAAVNDLFPPPPKPNYTIRSEPPSSPPDGAVARVSRVYPYIEYGGARVTIDTFATPEAAREAAQLSLTKLAPDTVSTFSIGRPAVHGIRYLANASLWVQPPDEGPFVDEIVFQLHNLRVAIGVADLPTGASHDIAQQLLSGILQVANPHAQ